MSKLSELAARLDERVGKYDEYDWHAQIELEAAAALREAEQLLRECYNYVEYDPGDELGLKVRALIE